jgi:hypothetical protein
MADTTISQLPGASAASDAVVAADSGDGSVTNKVTLASIAALGGGTPGTHASSHGSAGADPITPAAIGAVATSDSRLTDSRTPTSHNSSHFSAGTDPITPSDIGAAASVHTHTLSAVTDAGTAATKNFPAAGNASATEVVLGSDTRLTNTRTPTSHASSHLPGGSDAITPVTASPASLSTSQNDYAPGVADVVYLTSSAAVNLTGLVASATDGFAVLLMNVNASGGQKITLKHESASSSAANRFRAASGGDVVLYADGGAALAVYHSGSSRWRIL